METPNEPVLATATLDSAIGLDAFLMALREQLEQRLFVDVTVTASGQQFPAHRVILAASSPVLAARLSQRWSARGDGDGDGGVDVDLGDSDAACFGAALQFMYVGTIELTASNVRGVLNLR